MLARGRADILYDILDSVAPNSRAVNCRWIWCLSRLKCEIPRHRWVVIVYFCVRSVTRQRPDVPTHSTPVNLVLHSLHPVLPHCICCHNDFQAHRSLHVVSVGGNHLGIPFAVRLCADCVFAVPFEKGRGELAYPSVKN